MSPGPLEPRHDFAAQDVDLAVQQAALEAQFLLLRFEIVPQLPQLLVGEGAKVREKIRH